MERTIDARGPASSWPCPEGCSAAVSNHGRCSCRPPAPRGGGTGVAFAKRLILCSSAENDPPNKATTTNLGECGAETAELLRDLRLATGREHALSSLQRRS